MTITLTQYHAAVIDWLTSNEFITDWLSSAECYPTLENAPLENSAYFGVTNWENAEQQLATGEVTMVLSCQLLIAFPIATPNVALTIREALMTLCNELDNQRFGLQAKPLIFLGAEPYDFNPVLDECETWSIRWTHQINIGSVDPELIAQAFNLHGKILSGYCPEIGPRHEADYEVMYDEIEDD